jgi:hypothetical protein
MEDLFDRICDRTRARLDIPALRVLFGMKNRPHSNRAAGPPAQDIVTGKPQYGLAWFRIRSGLLQLKACTKGEHILRFEALDQLPLPSRAGATRAGGIDLNKPRIRAALAAALALAAAPHGFTTGEHAAKVRAMTGRDGYTSRQAAYDLRKFRGKGLAAKPGRTRATTSQPGRPARSPPCLPCATRSSPQSSAASAAPAKAADPPPGPASTGTTKPSASACRPLPRSRHYRQPRRRIGNILPVGEAQASRSAPLAAFA